MNNTRHLGVYGLIIKNNEILLVKKARGAYIGKYDLPGGSIEHGEKPIDTLKRELLEETGTIVSNAILFSADSVLVNWIDDNVEQSMHHIGIIYEVNIIDGDIKEEEDGLDSLGAVWYNISELSKDILSPLTYNCLLLKGYIIK